MMETHVGGVNIIEAPNHKGKAFEFIINCVKKAQK